LKAVSKVPTSEYYKERRDWLKKYGLCINCKEKAEPGKLYCFECAEKASARSRRYHQEHAQEKNERSRNRYSRLKESGICVRCGKRQAEKGKAHCSTCLAYCRIRDEKIRREKGLLPMEMRGDGYHCAICTRAVEKAGDKLCPACIQRNRKLADNMRGHAGRNSRWDRDNSRIFGGECDEKKRHDGAC